MQTAVVRDVLDDRLMDTVGDHRSRGWEVRQLVPTAYRWEGMGNIQHVTHWLIVLESDRPLPLDPAGT